MDLACVLSEFLFKPFCLVCHKPENSWLCRKCESFLEPSIPECYGCRKLSNASCTHASCRESGCPYERVTVLWKYDTVARKLMSSFKYNDGVRVGHLLGGMVVRRLGELQYEKEMGLVVVPVPLHWVRSGKRGHNQAEIISRFVLTYTGGRLERKMVIRKKNNAQQAHLKSEERVQNVKNIFAVRDNFDGVEKMRKIVVVDDVLTTGATINELGKTLHNAFPHVKLEAICLFRGGRR